MPPARSRCNLFVLDINIDPDYIHETQRLNAERLVHSEEKSNELGFSCLSPKILFYKRVKWFKILMTKLNH